MSGIIIEKLSETIKKCHGIYCLVIRNEDVAVYRKDSEHTPKKIFEVFIIKKIDGKKAAEHFNKMGGSYDVDSAPDMKEMYPSNESFGYLAWTYPNIEDAMKKFEFLTEREKRKTEESSLKKRV